MMSGLLPPLSSRTSGGVSPTCCCSTSLDRCDLLVGLEGFHLIAVARRACGLILDMESCDHFSGCPGCGVITQGYGCVVVEVVDAPWAGVPARIRWHRRRWICREHTRETRCTHKTGCSTEQRGGIALHGGPTRRRHAVRRLHVVQNPHHFRLVGRRIAYKSGHNVSWREKTCPARPPQRHLREILAQQAQKRRIWGVVSAQGELFRARHGN